MKRILQVPALLALVASALAGPAAVEDAAGRWLSVYAWLQTGERLAAAGQWPLALGSYLEADRLLGALAAAHPAFEPEMVAYRRGALAETIARAEARLTTDEHETMMKYLDFIESLELGEAQRYDGDFEAALGTLGMAKALLDEIVARKPAAFREAVASQLARLESGIAWLDAQVDFKARDRPGDFAGGSTDWGTTEFVKEADLPGEGEAVPLSTGLFPAALAAAEPEAQAEAHAASMALPPAAAEPRRYRLNSRATAATPGLAPSGTPP